ncbi:eukaryotic translation initiation factor 2D [Melitaea cinxia]|uniref:eukaryotic translation initiation factor 2D n=1 Tax=Melitaea cinxia TaxID=113334 RepID=UPI001E26EFE1|nr:eukaryotic translation initiation factor 2D [Melitaea cinxia]
MFAKPYKLKSNNTLKNSEKKQLAQRIQNEFPKATEEKVKDLVPVKSNSSCMKLTLHSGDTVGVYVVNGVPTMIDLGEKLVPTVYALWKAVDLVPTISVNSLVLSKVQGGAPLYAPGVLTDPSRFPHFPRGAVIAVCTSDNGAAGIVGRAVISSGDLLATSMGVCLETYHVLGDLLCKDSKFTKLERPKLNPICYNVTEAITADLSQLQIQAVKEEWPSLVKEETAVVNQPTVIPDSNQESQPEPVEQEDQNLNDSVSTELSDDDDRIPTDMDGLLRWCLLSFLKHEGKNLELPLKTNLLYKNHLMAYCPPDRTLDVKKSTYKKMGKFLEAMEREGLIGVREVEKGVSALVSLQPAHPLLRAHRAPPPARPDSAPQSDAPPTAPPAVRELYCVTAHVAELFAPLKKGAALSAGEVRGALQRLAAERGLSARGAVALDEPLARLTGRQPQELIKWEELISSVLGRMTPSTEMRYADGTVKLIKSRLEPVKMQVATRSGNKKVTLVSNLESFGFDLAALAHACQVRVGASCGVTRTAAARADQLMLQGDQTHFVAKLLIEEYGLPKKFLEGADKALNKKK